MKQIPCQMFMSDDGKSFAIVVNDCPVGNAHDFAMAFKGNLVDIMVKAHKQDQEQAEQQKKLDQQA